MFSIRTRSSNGGYPWSIGRLPDEDVFLGIAVTRMISLVNDLEDPLSDSFEIVNRQNEDDYDGITIVSWDAEEGWQLSPSHERNVRGCFAKDLLFRICGGKLDMTGGYQMMMGKTCLLLHIQRGESIQVDVDLLLLCQEHLPANHPAWDYIVR